MIIEALQQPPLFVPFPPRSCENWTFAKFGLCSAMTWFRVIKEACYSEQYIYDYLILTLGEISNFSNILYKLVLLFFFLGGGSCIRLSKL